MKKYLIFILSLFIGTNVWAQAFTADQLANGCGLPAQNCTQTIVDGLGQTTPVAGKFSSITNSGDTALTGATSQVIFPAASVITPSTSVPTPAAGNTLSGRYTILAAGAPTAAYVVLPVATASVGKTYTIFNQGSNPLAIVPQTGVINVSAALTPFSCTTLKQCQCTGLTTGVFGCSQQ